jgi:hypothetical protein
MSIAIYEKSTGTRFSGDAVHDGAIFDTCHSARAIYRELLKGLRELPVSVVYVGDFSTWIEAHND